MSEEIISEITTPELPSSPSGVVPALIGVAVGIGATLAVQFGVSKLKKMQAEKVIVVVPEETPKVD